MHAPAHQPVSRPRSAALLVLATPHRKAGSRMNCVPDIDHMIEGDFELGAAWGNARISWGTLNLITAVKNERGGA